MLYHYPQISKPVPVQYCNKHWHEYLSGNRPGSVASNPDSRKFSTKSLPSYGGSRMNPYSPTPVRSVSVASRPFTPKAIPPYVPSRKSRSMTRSLNRSFRSLSPASSYGDIEHSRDSDVDDLIQQANNLHVPPPPPPPIDFNPDQFIAYKMPCMFRCQYCGQTQPVFLPERGVPVINTPSGGQNGMPDSHISPSSLPKGVTAQIPKLNYTDPNLGSPSKNDKPISVNTKPNIPNSSMDSKSNFLNSSLDPKNSFLNSSLDPKTNSFNSSKPGSFVPAPSCYNPSTNTDNPSAPVAYFSTYPSGNLSNPISDSFPVLKMPHGSIPPGSQILIIPPGGTPGSKSSSSLGFPTSKYSSNIPPDLQKIMDKYCPERNSDDDKPSRDQLVADAMNRFEEKKKRKQKEDYLNSLKDKRQQANNGKDKKKSRLPIDSDEELIADPNKQKQLHSSNPFGFDDFGTVAPNSKSLRELELAATAAAKWWEKTKKRLDEEKKTGKRAKSKSPVRGRSSSGKDKPLNQKSGTPGRNNPGSSDPITPSKAKPKSSSGPSFKGKSAIPGSDDECIAEFPNRGKLESALDGLDFLDEPVESNNKSQPFGIGKKNKPFGSKNDPLENTKNDPFGNKKDPSERNKNGPSGSNRDDPFANDRNVPFGNKGDNSAKTSPYTKVPRIDVPGDSSVENTPRPGNRPPIKPNPTESSRPRSSLGPKRNVVPTTPRDFTPRLDKVDKDSDVESIRSGYIKSDRSKSENDKPKNLDLLSIQRAADAGAKWLDNVNINPKPKRSLGDPRRPADSKAQPRINFPDDDEDEILTAVPTNSLFSAPPPLITKNPASTGSLLSDPESLDAPPSERSNLPLTSPESQNGPLSPPNLPLSRYPGVRKFFMLLSNRLIQVEYYREIFSPENFRKMF